MKTVISLGELLIDSTPVGLSGQGHPLYEANPGGAPANMLSCMAKLGERAVLFACVGQDGYGDFLKKAIGQNGIDGRYVKQIKEQMTTLDVVTIYEDGDRDFVFYRNPGADTQIAKEDVDPAAFAGADLFHYGSLSLTHSPAREATLRALDLAEENGLLISYDPNLRPPLWPSLAKAKEAMLSVMDRAHVLKVGEDEAELLSGFADHDRAAHSLMDKYGLQIVFVTLGAAGSKYYVRDGASGYVPAITKGGIVDTTGAGDYFFGGALHCLLHADKSFAQLSTKEMDEIAGFANRCGYIVATQTGALGAKLSKEMVAGL